jgi:hypothetical protein
MDANMDAAQLSAREIALPIDERARPEQRRANTKPAIDRLPELLRATQQARRDNYLEEIAWFLVAVSTAALLVMSLFD